MRALLRALPLIGLGLLLFLYSRPGEQPVAAAGGLLRFTDVAREAGIDVVNVSGDPRRWYIPESNGCGAAWFDYEGDGDMDLFVANGAGMRYHDDGKELEVVARATSRLYRNDRRMRFTDISVESGAARSEWINALAVGDTDSDGDSDLYLGCFGPDVFLRREANRFSEATAEAGLGNELWAAGAAFGDANRDGHLDLYLANYCLFDPAHPPLEGRRNTIEGVEVAWGPEGENGRGLNPGAPDRFYFGDGRGGFREATAQAGLELAQPLCSYACVWSDVDDDGWQDILVANDLQPANLFRNQGEGHFRDEALERGFALNADGKPTSAMGLMVEDIDRDGDFDVLRTNFDLEPNALHVNDGRGNFQDLAATYGLAAPSLDRLGWGGGFLDADLDGDLDLLIANGHVYPQAERLGLHPWLQQSQFFEGIAHRHYGVTWRDATAESGTGLAPLRSSRGVAIGDPDDDGDPDALIVDLDSPPRLLENQSFHLGHWIGLRLIGRWSNRDAYGAKVQVQAGEATWTREVRTAQGLYSAHDPRLLFGLGDVDRIDAIRIRWPSGTLQVEPGLPIDAYHEIHERIADTPRVPGKESVIEPETAPQRPVKVGARRPGGARSAAQQRARDTRLGSAKRAGGAARALRPDPAGKRRPKAATRAAQQRLAAARGARAARTKEASGAPGSVLKRNDPAGKRRPGANRSAAKR